MARKLCFQIGDQRLEVGLEKLDRKKLYGQVEERRAVDSEGKPCYFASLSSDGAHLFGQDLMEIWPAF